LLWRETKLPKDIKQGDKLTSGAQGRGYLSDLKVPVWSQHQEEGKSENCKVGLQSRVDLLVEHQRHNDSVEMLILNSNAKILIKECAQVHQCGHQGGWQRRLNLSSKNGMTK
jgi:hypothetical protein